MTQNLKKHTCREGNFSTSRKCNLTRHFERKHANQSTFNGYAHRETNENSPFQGGQTPAIYQQHYQVHQTSGHAP